MVSERWYKANAIICILYRLVLQNPLGFTEIKYYADIILVPHSFPLSSREKFASPVKFLGLSQLLMLLPHWWDPGI